MIGRFVLCLEYLVHAIFGDMICDGQLLAVQFVCVCCQSHFDAKFHLILDVSVVTTRNLEQRGSPLLVVNPKSFAHYAFG